MLQAANTSCMPIALSVDMAFVSYQESMQLAIHTGSVQLHRLQPQEKQLLVLQQKVMYNTIHQAVAALLNCHGTSST